MTQKEIDDRRKQLNAWIEKSRARLDKVKAQGGETAYLTKYIAWCEQRLKELGK